MKTCGKCHLAKPLDLYNYNKSKRSKDGYYYVCRDCTKASSKKYINSGFRARPRNPYCNITRPSIYPHAVEVKLYGKNDSWFIIDEEDFELYSDYKFYTASGYVSITPDTQKLLLHRLIVDFEVVVHINKDRLDNRRSNLRSAVRSSND